VTGFPAEQQTNSLFVNEAEDSIMDYAFSEYEKRHDRYTRQSSALSSTSRSSISAGGASPPTKRQKSMLMTRWPRSEVGIMQSMQ